MFYYIYVYFKYFEHSFPILLTFFYLSNIYNAGLTSVALALFHSKAFE